MNLVKINLFILILVLIFPIAVVMAKDKRAEEPPAWMEYLNVTNTSRVLVPKGTQTKKIGNLTVVESVGEYTARKVFEIENKLSEFNKTMMEIKEDVMRLKDQNATILNNTTSLEIFKGADEY